MTSVRAELVTVVMESLTWTVTLYVPAKGVVAVSDAPDTDSHDADGLTDMSDQVYELVPPVAVSPTLYATPCVPPGRGLVLVTCNWALIVIDSGCGLEESSKLSVAVT